MKRDDMLDLNEALQHPGKKIAVDLSTELPDEADLDLVKPLEGFLEAYSTGNMLMIHGEFTTRCVVECARCAGPLEVDVEFTMDEEFPVTGVPSAYSHDDYARVSSEEDYPLFEENNLLVENLIRQGLWLNLPVQPLCKFGWDGPCPNSAPAVDPSESAPPSTDKNSQELKKLQALLKPEEQS